jgi:hypothetical protein
MNQSEHIQDIRKKLEIFNTDTNFVFDPIEHIYRYNGKIMYGTTSFLQRFVKPFESDFWAQKKADEAGITKEEILAQWDAKRDRSCDLGHMVHEYIENFYLYEKTDLTNDEEANLRIEKFHSIYDSRLKPLIPIASELKVFSKIWNIAGTIDQLYWYDGNVVIGDWKTNKKIKTDKDYCFGWLLPPFQEYKDNELNKYSLQISIYRLILEEIGIDTHYGFICHIPEKGPAEIYKLKDFRAELRNYFNTQLIVESINETEVIEKTKISKAW